MNGIAGGDMAGGADAVRIPRFLLEDSPKLAKKLKQFEEQQQKAKKAAAVLGDIEEIQGIKAQAKQARQEADTAMVEALSKSEAVVEEAHSQAALIVDKATQEAGKMKSESEKLLQNANVLNNGAVTEASVVDREKAVLQARSSELKNKEELLVQQAEALAERELELITEKEKLAGLSEHIRQTVG